MSAWTPPADLDAECLALCKAINEHVPGVRTVSSCCGHGKDPYQIWVQADSLGDLPNLLYWLDRCHTGLAGWRMIAYTDCSAIRTSLMIEGPVGAFSDADEIAARIAS